MKVRTLFFALSLFACGTGAHADDSTSDYIKRDAPKGITSAFYACVDKAGSDTTAMAACLTDERQKQDDRLNATYKTLLGKLDVKAKEKLIVAERAWLDFQDKSGRFEGALYGSEQVDNLETLQNKIFRICERANALQKYLAVADLK